MDPYQIIKGKQFKHTEYKQFSEERWMSLLRFFEAFLIPKGETEEFKVDQDILDKLEEENLDYREFYWRINQFDGAKSTTKMASLALNALSYLKKHPASVSDQMRSFITIRHPKFWGWCLKQYETKTTPAGEIVTRETDSGGKENVTLPSIQAMLLTNRLKVADFLSLVVDSMNKSDIRNMTSMEKIKVIKDLFPLLNTSKDVTGNTFTQINLNGSTRDMEEGILESLKKGKNEN